MLFSLVELTSSIGEVGISSVIEFSHSHDYLGCACFLWSSEYGMSLLAGWTLSFEVFRLVLLGEEAYFIW